MENSSSITTQNNNVTDMKQELLSQQEMEQASQFARELSTARGIALTAEQLELPANAPEYDEMDRAFLNEDTTKEFLKLEKEFLKSEEAELVKPIVPVVVIEPVMPVEPALRVNTIADIPEDFKKLRAMNLTKKEIRQVLDSLPVAEDGKPSVTVRTAGRIEVKFFDLFLIKALDYVYPGMCELTLHSNNTSMVVLYFPEIAVVDQKQKKFKVNGLYFKAFFDYASDNTVSQFFARDLTWARSRRTDAEHLKKFTLAHVTPFSAPTDFMRCCLGTSDLAFFKTDLVSKGPNFDTVCSMFVSAKGYAASEYIDGGVFQRIGTLRSLKAVDRYPEKVVVKVILEYLKRYDDFPGLEISMPNDNPRIRYTDSSDLSGRTVCVKGVPKVLYGGESGEYGLPTKAKLDVSEVNARHLFVLTFRGEDIYYVVNETFIEKPDDDEWVLHPSIFEEIQVEVEKTACATLLSEIDPRDTDDTLRNIINKLTKHLKDFRDGKQSTNTAT